MSRPWTPPVEVTTEDGQPATRVTVKRSCNGCGDRLGDATEAEFDAAVAGLPLPDVRDECPRCSGTGRHAAALQEAINRRG